MHRRVVRRLQQVTGAGFVGGLLLIALGLAGLSAGPVIGVTLLGVGVIGTALRDRLSGLVANPGFDAYLTSLPVGPLLAGVVVLVFAGASPGELQTLGGVIGLLALLNHLLRPVYGLLYALLDRVLRLLA